MNQRHRMSAVLTLSFAALVVVATEVLAEPLSITEIGVFPGHVGSRAYDINNNGLVVGFSYATNNIGMSTTQAFLWSPATGMQVISGSSGTSSIARAVNDKGQIVGSSDDKAFLWDEASGFRYLGGLWPGASGEAVDINVNGQVVGDSYVPGGTLHAFLWEDNSVHDLGTLGQYSHGKGINDAGQVIGYSKTANGPGLDITHAFLWEAGIGMHDLGTFGGSVSYGVAINDSGAYTGVSNRGGIDTTSLFYPSGVVIYDIGRLGGSTWAYSINNANQVVGSSYKSGQDQAFLWDPDVGMRNLNDLIPADSHWVLQYATSINDRGQIVGYGLHEGVVRGFLLSPTTAPPPDTTPPVITPSITGTLGDDGWYTSAVTVAWNVIDNESPVTSSSGCDATTLTADTSGQTVTCSATSVGGTSSNTVSIKIDKTPPTMSCTVTPNVLSPPNHKLVNIVATVNVADSLSGSGEFTLTSVTSNEPDAGLGNGDVPNDTQGWAVGTADVTGQLRAERWDKGDGRIYTLSYRSVDFAGNIARCNTTVSVPQDKKKK